MECGGVRGYPGKRLLDVAVAGLALVVMSPVMAVNSLVLAVTMGRPIFFRQARPGLGERIFHIRKFRTMVNGTSLNGEPLPDQHRLTNLGRFLRPTSLDELPESWSVLTGEMSLVGPKPLLLEYLPYYTKRERLRHGVPPGLTGLAQVSGRNLLGWDERLELNAQYVERVGLALDLQILWKKAVVVLRREGASPDAAAVGETRLDEERMAKRQPAGAAGWRESASESLGARAA